MIRLILNQDHFQGALAEALAACRHRLFIATADVKDVHLTISKDLERVTSGRGQGTKSRSIVEVFELLSRRGIEVRVLHGAVPSGVFLGELKQLDAAKQALGGGAARAASVSARAIAPSQSAAGKMPTGRAGQRPTPRFAMRRCCRMHVKAVIVDGRWMYLGSANLTGAGLGAKSPRRRNFEAGICTDEIALIDPVADMLEEVWQGARCPDCGRKDNCPVPLEEPRL